VCRVLAVIPTLVYQLVLIALVWLFLTLYWLGPNLYGQNIQTYCSTTGYKPAMIHASA
jgi:hypothetical protein